jgi:hypothetical protein
MIEPGMFLDAQHPSAGAASSQKDLQIDAED